MHTRMLVWCIDAFLMLAMPYLHNEEPIASVIPSVLNHTHIYTRTCINISMIVDHVWNREQRSACDIFHFAIGAHNNRWTAAMWNAICKRFFWKLSILWWWLRILCIYLYSQHSTYINILNASWSWDATNEELLNGNKEGSGSFYYLLAHPINVLIIIIKQIICYYMH